MNHSPVRVRAVLFDWDGTLLNSYAADSRAYLAMFREMKINWTIEDLDRHYSPNWHRVYRAARLPRALWQEADAQWALAYDQEKPRLLPGSRGVLRRLSQDFRLGIVTSGNRRRVRRQLHSYELREYFSACVCAEDTAKKKPHPEPLHLALKRIRCHRQEAVYVGDTAEDMEMARRAGVRAIGVRGPFPTAARLVAARPDVLLNCIRELPKYLRLLTTDEA